jgi:hypothetical protein
MSSEGFDTAEGRRGSFPDYNFLGEVTEPMGLRRTHSVTDFSDDREVDEDLRLLLSRDGYDDSNESLDDIYEDISLLFPLDEGNDIYKRLYLVY